MILKEYLYLVKSDLYRYCRCKSLFEFVRNYFFIPGFKYCFWLRTSNYLKNNIIFIPLYLISRFWIRRLQYKFGICIPYNTNIGSGLYIGHYGGIVVNSDAVIGKNCNLNHGVTIGATYGGKYPGVPIIKDNVYIGPGSFIIGGIEIGNHVAIGANTVVNKPIDDNSVIVGQPYCLISENGSGCYVVNTDY